MGQTVQFRIINSVHEIQRKDTAISSSNKAINLRRPPGVVVKLLAFLIRGRGSRASLNRGPMTIFQHKLLTRVDCDEAGDYVVPNMLSPRDLVFRPKCTTTIQSIPNLYKLTVAAHLRSFFEKVGSFARVFIAYICAHTFPR